MQMQLILSMNVLPSISTLIVLLESAFAELVSHIDKLVGIKLSLYCIQSLTLVQGMLLNTMSKR